MLLMISVILPVSAHETSSPTTNNEAVSDVAAKHTTSLHEKFDDFLKTAPANNFYISSLKTKKSDDILLDVRETNCYKQCGDPSAINIPFASLHEQLKTLDKSKKIYVISNTEIESAYAVFILRLHGLDAWIPQAELHPCPHHSQNTITPQRAADTKCH
jgi:hypothetical protein